MKYTFAGVLLLLLLLPALACTRPSQTPEAVLTPAGTLKPTSTPAPVASPSSISLALSDCEEVVVDIPYSEAHVEIVVESAALANNIDFPIEVTIEGAPPEQMVDWGQIVARCYRALHGRS